MPSTLTHASTQNKPWWTLLQAKICSHSHIFPSGEHRIIWAQPTHSSPSVQSPEHSLNSQICPYLWFIRRQQECLSAHPCTGRGEQGEHGVGNRPAGLVPSASVTKAKSVTGRSKNKK